MEIYLAFLYCVVLSHLTRSQHKDILENSGGIGGDGRNEGPLDRTRLVVKGGLLRPRPLMGVKYIRDAWIERSLQFRFSFSVNQNFQTLLPLSHPTQNLRIFRRTQHGEYQRILRPAVPLQFTLGWPNYHRSTRMGRAAWNQLLHTPGPRTLPRRPEAGTRRRSRCLWARNDQLGSTSSCKPSLR